MESYGRPMVAVTLIACSVAVYYFIVGGYCSLEWKDVVMIIVGSLVTNLTAVVQYYFGSSQGSTAKDAVLAKALDGK